MSPEVNPSLLAEAQSETTSPEPLRELSQSSDFHLRQAYAGNPNTPKEVLQKLAIDRHPYVFQEVAKNPKSPFIKW